MSWCIVSSSLRCFFFRKLIFRSQSTFPKLENAELDWNYFLNTDNHQEIMRNIKQRSPQMRILPNFFESLEKLSEEEKSIIASQRPIPDEHLKALRRQILWLPNKTHPGVATSDSEEPKILEKVGSVPAFSYVPASFDNLVKKLNILRTQFLGHISGSRGYFLKGDLANMERALVRYTVEKLNNRGFQMISVPDIVSRSVFECCGMNTEGKHSQVFHLDENWGKNLCLSGTAEMSLAAFVAQKTLNYNELPRRLCAVSRCYRAEAKRSQTEKGIYRVHYFTKVEMFGVTAAEGNESESLLQEFIEIQKDLFSSLGLHFQVAEMPPVELGLPAYHKIDLEAWMPGRKMYGEISSSSNCTDYQSRRLNIKYVKSSTPETKFCHTINGTACAIPRMLIAIFENFQNLDGSVNVPKPLQKYLNKTCIRNRLDEIMKSTKPVG